MDVKKIYIDTRYKSPSSNSDSDFFIDLPRTVNIEDDSTACYIDDIVLPISFSTINSTNDKLYMRIFYDTQSKYREIQIEQTNYTGNTLAVELETNLNALDTNTDMTWTVTYDLNDNLINISFVDDRVSKPDAMYVHIYNNNDLKAGLFLGGAIYYPKTLNEVLRLVDSTYIYEGTPYENIVDLHVIRNLYLVSSTLSNMNIMSNFGNGGIIKKIPITVNYNELMFDSVSSAFDFLELSKRSFNRLDFKLVDVHNNTIDLRNNHWSFSIVFVRR